MVRDRRKVGHGRRNRDRLAAGRTDFISDRVGRRSWEATNARTGTAEVVHDDLRSTARQKKCVLASQAPTRASDNGNTISQINAHGGPWVGGVASPMLVNQN